MQKLKRILQVVHGLGIGGTERVVCDLARAFNAGDFRTSVCCLDEMGDLGLELQRDKIRVHFLARRPGVDFSLTRRLRQLYRQEQVSIVHAHQYTPYFYAATAALGVHSPAVIFTEHGRHFPDRLRLKRAVFNQILRVATRAYTAVSEFTRESMVRFEKIPEHEIRVMYNGIHLNGGEAGIRDRAEIRTEGGIEPGGLLIISVGRIDPIKDFGTLIKAFANVQKQFSKAYLWIVGDGNPVYKKELLSLVEQLHLEGRVRFLGARHDIISLLSASDIFALPSITEATSMTILEAMSAGKPVVATRVGGNPELVINGDTGILVPVNSISAMAKALHILLEDPGRRESMGSAGRRRVEEHFQHDRMVFQYRELYRSIT